MRLSNVKGDFASHNLSVGGAKMSRNSTSSLAALDVPARMVRFCRVASSPPIPRNALRISFVVGSILNLINQGHNIFGDSPVSWPHFFMNYLVPFCVATYSATQNEIGRSQRHGGKDTDSTRLS